MPLYLPAATGGGVTPNVVSFEVNTPSAGEHTPYTGYDGWYDSAQASITSGEADTILATMGLTYASGKWTATRDGVFTIVAYFSGHDPGATYTNSMLIVVPDLVGSVWVSWGAAATGKPTGLTAPTEYESYRMTATSFVASGEDFWVGAIPGDTSLSAFDYLVASIMRLA